MEVHQLFKSACYGISGLYVNQARHLLLHGCQFFFYTPFLFFFKPLYHKVDGVFRLLCEHFRHQTMHELRTSSHQVSTHGCQASLASSYSRDN